MARLSKEQWEELKADFVTGAYTLELLAKKYKISKGSISKRAKKENWKKVDTKITAELVELEKSNKRKQELLKETKKEKVMYVVIEAHNNAKKSLCYLNDKDDIVEFYNKKKEEFKEKGYSPVGIRKFKRGRTANTPRYFNFRKIRYKNKIKIVDYYSYNIFKRVSNKVIDYYQNTGGLYSMTYCDEKRSKNMCFRFGEFEYKVLEELAKKFKVNPSDILRASLLNSFEKEIEDIEEKIS